MRNLRSSKSSSGAVGIPPIIAAASWRLPHRLGRPGRRLGKRHTSRQAGPGEAPITTIRATRADTLYLGLARGEKAGAGGARPERPRATAPLPGEWREPTPGRCARERLGMVL